MASLVFEHFNKQSYYPIRHSFMMESVTNAQGAFHY